MAPVDVALELFGKSLADVRTQLLAIPSECSLQFGAARTELAAEAVAWCVVIDVLTVPVGGKGIVE